MDKYEKLYNIDPWKNYKIYFRIPFTEYFLGWHYRFCLFRKKFRYKGWREDQKPYYYEKI